MLRDCHNLFVSVLLVAATGCQSFNRPSTSAVEKTTPDTGINYSGDLTYAVLWMQRAAEYRALCYQAYNLASERLLAHIRARQLGDKPLAVILDIDETVLDNSPYQAQLIKTDGIYDARAFAEWTAKAVCEPIPGAREFLETAVAQRVEVFYISNRGTNEFEGTVSNLKAVGFPMADARHVLLKGKDDKEKRRLSVSKDFEIIMLIGDNLNDFAEVFEKKPVDARVAATDNSQQSFGRRFIVLPNAMYGDWESAIYNYNFGLSPAERAATRRAILTGY